MKKLNILMASLMLAGMGTLATAEDLQTQTPGTPALETGAAGTEKPAKAKKARRVKKARKAKMKKQADLAVYQCEHCKKTSGKADSCCGMVMKKI